MFQDLFYKIYFFKSGSIIHSIIHSLISIFELKLYSPLTLVMDLSNKILYLSQLIHLHFFSNQVYHLYSIFFFYFSIRAFHSYLASFDFPSHQGVEPQIHLGSRWLRSKVLFFLQLCSIQYGILDLTLKLKMNDQLHGNLNSKMKSEKSKNIKISAVFCPGFFSAK